MDACLGKEDLGNLIETLKMWAYSWVLKISWFDKISNEVLRQVDQKHKLLQAKKRKIAYLEHVRRRDRYKLLPIVIEKVPMKDIKECTGIKCAVDIPQLAKHRTKYAKLTANLHLASCWRGTVRRRISS